MKQERFLVCGAHGFVGRHVVRALRAHGHHVRCAVRHPAHRDDVEVNFLRQTDVGSWQSLLNDVDVVINAVGVLRDGRANPMSILHGLAPSALFAACAQASVKRIVHFSALGMDRGINTAYFRSRVRAEQSLHALPAGIHYLCLRPSLIYGGGGASAKLFTLLAKLPIHLLPNGGNQQLQPVHINDITQAIINWLAKEQVDSRMINAVGSEVATVRELLASYREQFGLPPARQVAVSDSIVQLAAYIGDAIPISAFCSDTLTMLNAGNTADASEFAELLQRAPMSYRHFILNESK